MHKYFWLGSETRYRDPQPPYETTYRIFKTFQQILLIKDEFNLRTPINYYRLMYNYNAILENLPNAKKLNTFWQEYSCLYKSVVIIFKFLYQYTRVQNSGLFCARISTSNFQKRWTEISNWLIWNVRKKIPDLSKYQNLKTRTIKKLQLEKFLLLIAVRGWYEERKVCLLWI